MTPKTQLLADPHEGINLLNIITQKQIQRKKGEQRKHKATTVLAKISTTGHALRDNLK